MHTPSIIPHRFGIDSAEIENEIEKSDDSIDLLLSQFSVPDHARAWKNKE